MLLMRKRKPRAMIKHWYNWFQKRPVQQVTVSYEEPPDKSEGDKKIYRTLTLSNGLRAMLISDPLQEDGQRSNSGASLKTSTAQSSQASYEHFHGKLAACAVLINAGSFYESPRYQGLAHFLEHMIFMGSKKYPEENAFDAFVTKSGGFSNAHTENEDTCFYFEVEEQYFDKALDMFMNLMKEPLLDIDAMARERSAVQSEFEQTHMVDEVRRDQILASMASKGYPHGTFGWGNLKSLKENLTDQEVYDALHEFRRKHYGSNRMYVCLQATFPLDELEQLLLRHCGDIPQSEEPPMDVSDLHYDRAFQERFHNDLLLVQPVEDVCKLELTWVLPPVRPLYRTKPAAFISHLIGYEGVGSLCSFLRRRLWCMSIMAGVGMSSFETNSIYSLFNMCIHLTDEGFAHLDEVMAATFAWIRMVNACDTLHVCYDEVQQVAANNFRFQIEIPALDNVQTLVEALRIMPPKDVLSGTELYFEYDERIVQLVRQHLDTFKFNIMISSHIPFENYDYDKREPWFGTNYRTVGIPSKWQEMWDHPMHHDELQLPKPNPFVTTDFTLHWLEAGRPHIPRRPKALIKDGLCELWFRQDDTFLLPDGFINLYLISPLMRRSVEDYVAAVIFIYLVEYAIAEQLYPALMAGLTYSLDVAEKGLVLCVSGYNQKLPQLIEMIVDVMQNLEFDAAHVMSFKELKKRQLFNAVITGKSLNLDLRLTLLEHMRFTLMEKYEAVDRVTMDHIRAFRDTYGQQMYVQALIQGNFTEQQALDVVQNVLQTYQSERIEHLLELQNRSLQVPLGEHYLRVKNLNEDDTSTVITNYYQVGPSSLRLECMLDVVDLIAEEPFFNQLRTQEQLCYSLGIFQRLGYGVMAYMLIINTQENKHNADYVDKRLEAYRLRVPSIVKALSDEEFYRFRETIINNKRLGDHSLFDEVMRNWSEIVSMDYFFNRCEMQVQMLATITKQDCLDFFFQNETYNLRKLSVQVIGNAKVASRSQSYFEDAIAQGTASRQQQSTTEERRRPGSLGQLVEEVQHNISQEQFLFEQLGDRIELEFLGDPTDPRNIFDVAGFKNSLFVFPVLIKNPKQKS